MYCITLYYKCAYTTFHCITSVHVPYYIVLQVRIYRITLYYKCTWTALHCITSAHKPYYIILRVHMCCITLYYKLICTVLHCITNAQVSYYIVLQWLQNVICACRLTGWWAITEGQIIQTCMHSPTQLTNIHWLAELLLNFLMTGAEVSEAKEDVGWQPGPEGAGCWQNQFSHR